MLSRDQARAFYDRFGAKQDQQRFYEDPATRDLLRHADFAEAQAVFEFGCGTGRFAAELFAEHLPPAAQYVGCDVSETMIGLARQRLVPYGSRAEVRHTDGSPRVDSPDQTFDRFVSNYVLDLLSPEDIRLVLAEAYRVLTADGCLCLVSLTHGPTAVSGCVSWVWSRVHRFRPALVGGCRPIELVDFLDDRSWKVEYRNVIVAVGIPSEVVVARKRQYAAR